MIELVPLVETGILSLCVSLPIFIVRRRQWVSSSTSRKLLHICFLSSFRIMRSNGAHIHAVLAILLGWSQWQVFRSHQLFW